MTACIKHRAAPTLRSNPRPCGHQSLAEVEADVDTEVFLYVCAACGKSFAVSDAYSIGDYWDSTRSRIAFRNKAAIR